MNHRSSSILSLIVLGVLISSSGCGPGPDASALGAAPAPYRGSPIVGRWVDAGHKLILEFLEDGTFVELRELESQRSTRLPDGTFRKETVPAFQCHMGTFHLLQEGSMEYDLTQVASFLTRKGTRGWELSPEGEALTLQGEGSDGLLGTFVREDRARSPEAQKLIGLWRRKGNPTLDYVDMGVRFTPGGLAIVVGKNARWDRSSWTGSIGWLCLFTRWELEGRSVLVETRPGSPEQSRARDIEIADDHFTWVHDGIAGWSYERVHGVVPLRDGQLDARAWNGLK